MKQLGKELLNPPKVGDIVEGKIIDKRSSAVFLDLGKWGTGIIYGIELLKAKDQLKKLKKGDRVFAKIIELDNEEGYIELSLSEASKDLAWVKLQEKKEKGEEIQVKILGANKGGLVTKVFGIPAFLPLSQLKEEHYPKVEGGDPLKILRHLQKFVGKQLRVKIFDLSPKEEKLILSEKAKTLERKKEILRNYQVGEVVEGEITGITDFGAFVKFGSPEIEGLIHISELDWKSIEDPAEVVKIGQKVKAKIIQISKDKVFLSLKALKKVPENTLRKS